MQSSSSDEEYEVEEILEKRIKKGEVSYKVKWKGYPLSESSKIFLYFSLLIAWEPANNLDNAKKAV